MSPEQARKYRRLGLLLASIFMAIGGLIAITRQEFTYFGWPSHERSSYAGASAIVMGLFWFGLSSIVLAGVVGRGRLRMVLGFLGGSFLVSALAAQAYVALSR